MSAIRNDIQDLIQQLRADGINDEGIRTRLISDGVIADTIEDLIQSPSISQNTSPHIQLSQSLSLWIEIHYIMVIFFACFVGISLGFGMLEPSMLVVILPLLADVSIQFWCLHKLEKSERQGYYGLLMLFIVRTVMLLLSFPYLFFIYLPINVIDATLLHFAYKTHKPSTKKKRKIKLTEDMA